MQRENKWQDRFDKLFVWRQEFVFSLDIQEDVKTFIQSEIDLAVKEERERISKLLS